MITLQLLQQIIVFFLMMACGFAVVKCGLIRCEKQQDTVGDTAFTSSCHV